MALIPRYLSTARGGLSAAAATLLLGAGLAPAAAQEAPAVDLASPLANELLSCVAIEDDAARLACFDRTAAPLARAVSFAIIVFGEIHNAATSYRSLPRCHFWSRCTSQRQERHGSRL